MKFRTLKSTGHKARRGLTLIELLIVMVILAALAGILVPMLAGTITKAHGTSAATNMSEIAKAIQTYQATNLGYPDKFDSLVDGSGALLPYILDNTTTPDLTTVSLTGTTGIAGALSSSGISNVAQMMASAGGTWSPTFYPYGADSTQLPTFTSISTATALAGITPAAASREFGLPSTINGNATKAQYVIFGVGAFTSMQGTTMLEAPVHFDDDPAGSPLLTYARFGAVFQVTDPITGLALNNAKLIGVVDFSSGGINNINDHLNDYWSSNK